MSEIAVTFDFGQTLTELDCDFLARRLAQRDIEVRPDALLAALPDAWRAYDVASAAGTEGGHPWHLLMHKLLQGAAVDSALVPSTVEWLWNEQPKCNLWRKPIPGMIEVVRKIAQGGTKVAVISNSEGKLAQLAEEMGWQSDFEIIADSGRLGFAKPGPKIFQWTSRALGIAPENFIHVGDSWAADVEGVLGVGGRALWFAGASTPPPLPTGATDSPRVRVCHSASDVERALRAWRLPFSR